MYTKQQIVVITELLKKKFQFVETKELIDLAIKILESLDKLKEK